MFDYKTISDTKPNNFWLVMNNETDGWELCQIVPECSALDGAQLRYHYWFRRPMYPKTPTKPAAARQRVMC